MSRAITAAPWSRSGPLATPAARTAGRGGGYGVLGRLAGAPMAAAAAWSLGHGWPPKAAVARLPVPDNQSRTGQVVPAGREDHRGLLGGIGDHVAILLLGLELEGHARGGEARRELGQARERGARGDAGDAQVRRR